ncbi:MAG TPA: NAD-dependent epimerase/dehydratase family protein [Actinomycetota bacterium]|nr:NAD-dependent epimerase/dehydratase family protein [Actinomycetota bacterium]
MTSANGSSRRLTVAVTGPTGSIGRSFVRLLERTPEVERVLGMARRPFDPKRMGLRKLEYRRGDVLNRASVDALVEEADVVVHLAFLIMGSHDETEEINMRGSRNVFESAFAAEVKRLVYTSSVAAYGFHKDNPEWLTEKVHARGSDNHYYSRQKAQLEEMLANLGRYSDTDVYVFRPCIVAGPDSTDLVEQIPLVGSGDKVPGPLRKLGGALPMLRPVIPDPGIPFQLVHEDDVAQALVAGVLGEGPPGTYNLAADGEMTLTDLAHALGWYAVPVPELAVETTAAIVSRLPLMPAKASWVNALRVPVLMDTTKAKNDLGWAPDHDVTETLMQTIDAARTKGLLSRRA